VAEEAGRRVEGLSARETSNVAWAFATVQVPMPRWLTSALPRRAGELGPQECANALWALAVASQSVAGLTSALPRLSQSGIGGAGGGGGSGRGFGAWKPQELANAAWALGRGAHGTDGADGGGVGREGAHAASAKGGAEAFRRGLHRALAARVGELNGLELAMVASALPSMAGDDDESGLLPAVISRTSTLLVEGRLASEAVVQLREGLLASAAGPAAVPPALREAFEAQAARTAALLRRVSEPGDASQEAVRALPALGLTTLGAQGTADLLRALGLLARGANGVDVRGDGLEEEGEEEDEDGDDEPAAYLQGVPTLDEEGGDASPQVLCSLRHHLLLSAEQEGGGWAHRALSEPGRVLRSGGQPDGDGGSALALALEPVTLRFARDRDAEFLALSAVLASARRAAQEVGAAGGGWKLHGTVRLHVTHTPCLSCVSAMLQLRRLLPDVRLRVSFDAARPPARAAEA